MTPGNHGGFAYQTMRYDVFMKEGSFGVRNLYGRVYRTGLTFGEACLLADLYQDEDDSEAAREAFDDEHFGDP